MFSLAVPLIFFSSNLKQYSLDVVITLVVIGLALLIVRESGRLSVVKACAFAFASILLLSFSQVAVFSIIAAGAAILAESFFNRRADRGLRLAMVAVWAAAAIGTIAYSKIVMTPADNAYLHRFWADAFMPQEGRVKWLWEVARQMFAGHFGVFDGSLHYPWPNLFTGLFLVGVGALCATNPANGFIIAGPIALVLTAASLQSFPIGTRVCLFLLPLFLLLVVVGAESLASCFGRQASQYASVLLVPVAIMTTIKELPPRMPQHLRPVMQHLANNWKLGDAIWVYYGAGQAFLYYVNRWPIKGNIHIGECDRNDPRSYLRDLDKERGRSRLWVLMAHGSGAFRFDERKLIITYLDKIGTRIGEFHAPREEQSATRAEVILYDLSNDEKLASSSADVFSVEGKYIPQIWSCYGTMSPMGSSEHVIEMMR